MGVVISSDGAAHRDPAVSVHVEEDGLGDVSPHIVEIAVDTSGSRSPHCSLTREREREREIVRKRSIFR